MTITGDGNQTRDFIHVQDVVQANMLAMESDNGCAIGEIFNVAYGKSKTVNEISRLMGDRFIKIPEREGEIKNISANISKINGCIDELRKIQGVIDTNTVIILRTIR